jgi:undecaprenyl pyrophosphate phosphatase UppP
MDDQPVKWMLILFGVLIFLAAIVEVHRNHMVNIERTEAIKAGLAQDKNGRWVKPGECK